MAFIGTREEWLKLSKTRAGSKATPFPDTRSLRQLYAFLAEIELRYRPDVPAILLRWPTA